MFICLAAQAINNASTKPLELEKLSTIQDQNCIINNQEIKPCLMKALMSLKMLQFGVTVGCYSWKI